MAQASRSRSGAPVARARWDQPRQELAAVAPSTRNRISLPTYGAGRGMHDGGLDVVQLERDALIAVMYMAPSARISTNSWAPAPAQAPIPDESSAAASSNNGSRAGCWSASAAPGLSSTRWNAFSTASALKTCFTVGSG